jgi:integrase
VTQSPLWSASVGFLPHKVMVYENAERGGVLYLRWRERNEKGEPNWRKESLHRPLPRIKVRGVAKPDPEVEAWARERAAEKYAQLVKGVSASERGVVHALTIAEGVRRLLAPETGKYPSDTPHRREVARELAHVVRCLGGDTRWELVRRQELRRLWRYRIRQLRAKGDVGHRGAEVTVQRLLAAAQWLRDEEIIASGACVAPKHWKALLLEDWQSIAGPEASHEPKRPRHSLDEMRRILVAAEQVDPRFALALQLGAELRLGQVLRARRSDLDLAHETLTIRGRKNKRGVVEKLTKGQMHFVEHALSEGYLRDLEKHAPDYPLFPAGQMPGGRSGAAVATVKRHASAKPIDRSVLDDWWQEAEALAEVPHIEGRGPYGVRRRAVDEVKRMKGSREALKEIGGWTDSQTPDSIYADTEQDAARTEAMELRAKIRGEE